MKYLIVFCLFFSGCAAAPFTYSEECQDLLNREQEVVYGRHLNEQNRRAAKYYCDTNTVGFGNRK